MKNITLSVDEKALKAARIYAAEHDTTVNALVREFLARFVRARAESSAEERAKAREELVRLAEQSTGRLGPDWKWNREDLYDRPVFSRHEHPDIRRGRKAR
jgi:hypothetical protein